MFCAGFIICDFCDSPSPVILTKDESLTRYNAMIIKLLCLSLQWWLVCWNLKRKSFSSFFLCLLFILNVKYTFSLIQIYFIYWICNLDKIFIDLQIMSIASILFCETNKLNRFSYILLKKHNLSQFSYYNNFIYLINITALMR